MSHVINGQGPQPRQMNIDEMIARSEAVAVKAESLVAADPTDVGMEILAGLARSQWAIFVAVKQVMISQLRSEQRRVAPVTAMPRLVRE